LICQDILVSVTVILQGARFIRTLKDAVFSTP